MILRESEKKRCDYYQTIHSMEETTGGITYRKKEGGNVCGGKDKTRVLKGKSWRSMHRHDTGVI